MNNTCKMFWDDSISKFAVAFVDSGNCEAGTAHYSDTESDRTDLALCTMNWVANNIACWKNWKNDFMGE